MTDNRDGRSGEGGGDDAASRRSGTRKSVNSKAASQPSDLIAPMPEFARVQLRKIVKDESDAASDTVPDRETRPEFARLRLRRAAKANRRKSVKQDTMNVNGRPNSLRRPVEAGDNVVRVELLPSGGLGANITVAGYGHAPNVVEVFSPDDDDDDLVEADQLEQIELNNDAAMQQEMINIDLSGEYQRPKLERAIEYARMHSPLQPDGAPWPLIKTRTGRFIPKWLDKVDPCCEARKSDLIVYGAAISAYFKWVKALTWLFFFMCVVQLPILVVNANGGTRFDGNPIPFAVTTLGNLFIAYNSSTDSLNDTLSSAESEFPYYNIYLPGMVGPCGNKTTNGCQLLREDLLFYYALWDAGSCLAFFLALQYIQYFTMHEGIIYKEKVPKIEDYSIACNVPDGADAVSLQDHFETLLTEISREEKEAEDARAARDERINKAIARGDIASGSENENNQNNDAHKSSSSSAIAAVVVDKVAERREKLKDIVYDIQIVESTGNAISLCVRRGRLLKSMARLDAKIKVYTMRGIHETRIAPLRKQFADVLKHIEAIDERAGTLAEKGRPMLAYVTFESQEARAKVLARYDVFWLCGMQPKILRYRGLPNGEIIRVRPAPPPSTLLWENQEISPISRFIRTFFSGLLFLSILGFSVGISFLADNNKIIQELVNYAGTADAVLCNNQYPGLTLAQAAPLAKEQGNTLCFCEYAVLFENSAPTNATGDISSLFIPPFGMCSSFVEQKVLYIGEEVGISIAVSTLNIITYFVVIRAADFEKFTSVVDREFAVMRVIFLITLINSAVIVLLINVNWAALLGEDSTGVSVGNTTIISFGNYVDFEPLWYEAVGIEIFLLCALLIVTPHVIPLLRLMYHAFQRRYVAPYVISQQVLNEMYVGEEFVLSVRLAQTTVIVFFCLMYSSGLPILYWVTFVACFTSYFFDKLFFLRLVRTPPQFTPALQMWATRFMEWAIVVHCFFGFWMYSSPLMFPETAEEAKASVLNDLVQSLAIPSAAALEEDNTAFQFLANIQSRFDETQSLIMIICGLAIIAYKFLRRVAFSARVLMPLVHEIRIVYRACFKRGKPRKLNITKHVHHAALYSEALEEGRVVGVLSYNILSNPLYSRLFELDNVGVHGNEDPEAGTTGGNKDDDDDENEGDEENPGPLASKRHQNESGSDAGSMHRTASSHQSSKHHGYQTLKETLNIKKGASTARDRSAWKDSASSAASGGSKVSTLFPSSSSAQQQPVENEGDDSTIKKTKSALSVKSSKTKPEGNDDASSQGAKSSKSVKTLVPSKSSPDDDAHSHVSSGNQQ